MLRSRSVVAAALTALLATVGCGSSLKEDDSGSKSPDATVKIGLLIPQSGVYAPLGKDLESGFRLYLDQHGGKLGGRQVSLVVADEGEGPQTGVPAAQKLVQQDGVDAVVGVVNSATALGVKDVMNTAKVPLIIANAGADALTGDQKSEYVWRTSFSNSEVAKALGPQVAKDVQGGSVYLVAPDYAAGKESIAGFRDSFQAAGGKVAGSESTPFGTTQNFQPYLARIAQSGAKAVYCFYAGAEAVAFVKQYQEFGLSSKIPLYCNGFATEGSVLTAQGDAALGVKTSLHYSDQLQNPVNTAFVAAYSGKYGSAPTVYSVQAYDAAQVLDKTLAAATDGPGLVSALGAVGDIDSPRGTWRFNDGHGPTQTYYLREVVNSQGKKVNSVIGPLQPAS